MTDSREAQFREVVAYAEEEPDVLGLFVFGSRTMVSAIPVPITTLRSC